jgi:L-rhamnose mutarotase
LGGIYCKFVKELSINPAMEYPSERNHKTYKRYCKTLTLEDNPQLIEEYKKVHAPGAGWPEISRGMIEVGILDMEIYITGTHLFMIMDTVPDFNHNKAMAELATKPRQSEWEAYVSRFQRTSAEASADKKWQLIERIYKLNE